MQAPWPFSCQQSAKIEGIGLEGRVQLRLDEQEDLISDVVYECFIFGGVLLKENWARLLQLNNAL